MQFPVPQFTEVEDKIIGPFSIKQFGIAFAAGILIFAAFSISKSVIVLILFSILFGLPALGLIFAKPNGRPMYNMIGQYIKFFTSPRVLIFYKQGLSEDQASKISPGAETGTKPEQAVSAQDTRGRLKEVNAMLEKQAEEERELFKK